MDVACLGILVADLFLEPVDTLPQAGELKTTEGFVTGAGGCAANVAQCLRKLGRSVGVVGKVGRDRFGDYVIDELRRQGAETAHIRRSDTRPTSSTVIINVVGEDRRYLHCIGANGDLTIYDVDVNILEATRILYVGGYLAMPSFGAGELTELLKAAKERNAAVVLDVVIPAGKTDAAAQLFPALPYVDYFLPNEDEARGLTGSSDPVQQARVLADYNPEMTVVITRGPEGSVALHGGQILRIEPFRMTSVDESGAGDAFTAGFITGLLEKWSVPESLRFASAVGASCTRALGCIDGVFRFDEAVSFLSAHRAA
jgi:sugar/nucleoside kinase (ribokinase family)